MNIRVIKCTCHGVKFTRMKEIAERHNSHTLFELKQHVQFAENCKRCVPYVLRMLETGKTEFQELLELDESNNSNDKHIEYGDEEEL
ncbi:(2Fe-2S)-binding protein [Gemmatimonas aurantiaca]|nr:(2Fe-2S)-binding protein [Gemmatimonas aurantiaca]